MRAVVKRLMFQGWIGKIGRIGYLCSQTKDQEPVTRDKENRATENGPSRTNVNPPYPGYLA